MCGYLFASSFQQRTICHFSLGSHELQLLSYTGKPNPLYFLDDSGRPLYVFLHINILTGDLIHLNLQLLLTLPTKL